LSYQFLESHADKLTAGGDVRGCTKWDRRDGFAKNRENG